MRNILFEVTPTNKATGTTVTVRLSAIEANASGTQLDGFEWMPAIIDWPERSISLTSNGELSPISVSHGSLSFVITDNRALADLVWTGAYGRCFVGNMGDPFASYKPIFEGRCGPIAVDGGLATVTLLGLEADLDRPLLTIAYAGTGGAEGGSGLKGKLKPWASGNCLNIEPILIDPAKLIYQYHGYGPTQAVDNVFEAALSLGAPAQTVSTYSALASLTLAKGTWAAAPATGMFRLANQPKGTITADVRAALDGASYPATLAAIAPHLIKHAGVLPSAIDSTSFAAHSEEWCFFTTAQTSVGDVVRDALSQVGGYLMPSSTGAFRAGDFFGASTAKALSADGSSDLHLLGSTIKEAPSPVYRVTIGNRPSWRVMSGSEVSPALSSVSDDAYAAAQAAQDAADAAAEAQADATAANIRIASISADGVLDRAEKPQILREYAAIGADVTEHGARADALGVDKSAMVASFNMLTVYLSGLSPAWDNTAVDTPIDRIAFNGRFSDARQAIAALAAANAAKAATLSTWNGVSGPGKPADNATVGAPGDTPVGASTGNQVVADIIFAKQAIDGINTLTTSIAADIDDLFGTYGTTASAAASASAAAQHDANAQTAAQNADAARIAAEGAYASAFTQAGQAETFRNQASTYSSTAQGYAATASEQASLAANARTSAENAAAAANTSAGTASAKANEAGVAASAAQTSQVRASTFALDAAGRATNNIVGRSAFDERGRGSWEGQAQALRDDGSGGFYVLQQTNRDVFEGEFIPGNWSERRFRVTGKAAAYGAYIGRAGLQCLMADGSHQYPLVAAGGPYWGYADFSGEIVLPQGVSAARPFLQSDGPWDAGNHGVNWRTVRIEDITAERRAKDFADAASTSYSNAEIKAGEAGSYASAASGHSNTASIRASDAASAASTASGAAAVATDKAAQAASSASLSASYANDATARIDQVEQVAASANQAVAQRVGSLEATTGGQTSRLNTVEQVAATAFDRVSGARWSKEAIAGNGRAQLTVYAYDNGGNLSSGVDIIGDVAISGNLMVGGSITTGKIANNAVTRMASFYSACSHGFGGRATGQWYELAASQIVDYDEFGNPIYSGQSARLVFTGLVSNSAVMLNIALDHYRTGSNDDTWGARVIRRRYGNDPVQIGDSYMVRSRSGYTITTLPFMDVVPWDGDYSYQVELARYGDGGVVDYVNISGIIGQK